MNNKWIKLEPSMLHDRHSLIDLDTMTSLPGNPNVGKKSAIKSSLESFGQFDSIVVWRGTVLIGNNRVDISKGNGVNTLAGYDLSDLDLPESQRKAMALASNRTGRLGHDDPDDLLAMLETLEEPAQIAAGYGDGFIGDLKAVLEGLQPMDLDEAPSLDTSISPGIDDMGVSRTGTTLITIELSAETAALWSSHRSAFPDDESAMRSAIEDLR